MRRISHWVSGGTTLVATNAFFGLGCGSNAGAPPMDAATADTQSPFDGGAGSMDAAGDSSAASDGMAGSDVVMTGDGSATGDAGEVDAGTCGAPAGDGGWVPTPGPTGLAPIPSEFDPQTAIFASYMPNPNTDDVVGAFRFICSAGQLLWDDPLVHPGHPGRSHLHQFYGNTGANACSTFESLRTTGASTCGSPDANPANRSAYWIPALLDGRGNVVQPAYAGLYYKRTPKTDPDCTNGVRGAGCLGLPNGLRLIFGFNLQTGIAETPFNFYCDAVSGNYTTLSEAVANCPVGAHVIARADAPFCWDGMNLDSPDHRSHMSYTMDTHLGYFACPSTHPWGIPALTLSFAYLIAEGDDTSLWHFSSDEQYPNLPPGSTMHADYFEAWDNTIKSMWTDHCIDEKLNCSGGALGNGYSIIGADQPRYLINGVWTAAWENPNRLVPIPPPPPG